MNDDSLPEVSIVAACRNEAHHVGGFLDSLTGQETGVMKWEAILADGMSDDGTGEILEAYGARNPQVRVITNPGRIVSTGLNAAIRAARGEIILRMDVHTQYAPDYVKSCVETLRRTGADNVGGPARTVPCGLQARAIAAAYHSPFSTGGAKFHDVEYEGWVDTVPYGCWRKSTLERIGLFDENLVRSQDDEHNLRILRAGGRIWQSPAIVSWYSPRSSLSALFRQYLQYGFWKVAVIRKYRTPGSWRHLVPAAFVAANGILLAGMAIATAGTTGWSSLVAKTWLVILCMYGGANLAASAKAARTYGWATFPQLPLVFAIYHVSYGLGFLFGLLRCLTACSSWHLAADSVFARITR